jgi:hypothetical protein
MTIEGISMECATEAEALDVIDEMRYLAELADDGEFDLGPGFRSLLRSAYWAINGVLEPGAPVS